jgi:hypothetical protein
MTDIINKLDETLLGLMPNDGIRFFGLCQQVVKGEQTHPVTIDERKQVSIQDNWDVICFHRRLGTASIEPSDEQDFGRSIGRKVAQNMRTFVAHKVDKGEEWIYDFANNMPVHVDIAGVYEFVDIGGLTLNTDQVAIYNEEFGENSYEKHIQDWNIYALEYAIEFIRC